MLVGPPRPVISNWENGSRHPNSQQLTKLAAIYRTTLADLLGDTDRERPNFEGLVFREAGERVEPRAKYEIQRFLAFVDDYGSLLEALGEPPGLMSAPFSVREGFLSKDDVRRKAEEARTLLRLGSGPIGDLASIADLQGITIYHAPLGDDFKRSV